MIIKREKNELEQNEQKERIKKLNYGKKQGVVKEL